MKGKVVVGELIQLCPDSELRLAEVTHPLTLAYVRKY
jgi:hypothetical protein